MSFDPSVDPSLMAMMSKFVRLVSSRMMNIVLIVSRMACF